MAFNEATFVSIAHGPAPAAGSGHGLRLHWYSTNDTVALVIADDYFLTNYKVITPGDIIIVSGDMDGTDMVKILLVKVSSSTTVTVVAAQGTLADLTENAGAIGGTNDGNIATLTPTSGVLTDSTAGTANTTLQAITDGTTWANDVAAVRNNFADLAAMDNKQTVDIAVLVGAVRELATKINAMNAILRTNGITKAA